MKSQNVILTLFLILLLSGIFLCRKWQEPLRKEALDRTPNTLLFSRLAVCELTCQQLGEEDVKQVFKRGIILLNRSQRYRRPCPTYTIQGLTTKGKSLRIIFEQCRNETKVMSCYLLKSNFTCDCPVDTIKEN